MTLWDTESWQQVSFPVKPGDTHSLAWSPDGKMLSAVSMDNIVRIWEVPSAKLLHTFEGLERWNTAVAWSPDGNTIAARAPGTEFRIWDTRSGKLLQTVKVSASAAPAAAFSPGGQFLAVGHKLFDTRSWSPLRQLNEGGDFRSLAWSADGATLAMAGRESSVLMYDVKTGEMVRKLESHPGVRGGHAWSFDGKKIASCSGLELRIWDADSAMQLRRSEENAYSPAWSPDGTSIAALHSETGVHIFHSESEQRLRSWKASVIPQISPTWSPDGKWIATAAEKTVQVWAAGSGRLVHTLQGHTTGGGRIAWSPNGKMIATGLYDDKTVRLWDASSAELIHSFEASTGPRLSWSPDGKSLASSDEKDVRVWDIAAKALQVRCTGALVGWTADSVALITHDNATGLVRWWDRQTGDRLRETKSDIVAKWSIARPDGRFAACVERGALDIWEIARGATSLTLVPLRGGQWLAIRPDGHYRGSPGVEEEIVYVVQSDAGQELLTPAEFARRYGWKNDPQCVRLPPSRDR
jgi:WD40 repeat protein